MEKEMTRALLTPTSGTAVPEFQTETNETGADNFILRTTAFKEEKVHTYTLMCCEIRLLFCMKYQH
jgi:hypothetical protein